MNTEISYMKAAQLAKTVASAPKPLLVCFTRRDFAPSDRLRTALHALPAAWEQKLSRICIDVDEDPETMDALRVFKVPEMMLYANGRVVERAEGEHDVEALESWLHDSLSRLN